MSSHLVCFGWSWYVPVHGVPGHRPVGRRARDARAAGRHARRRERASPRRPRCFAATACGGSSRPATAPPTTWRTRSGSPRSRRRPTARRSSPCRAASRSASGFRWRDGDAVLAVSSSGEFRDVVEIARARAARGRASRSPPTRPRRSRAAATATVLQTVANQRAVTHTQALVRRVRRRARAVVGGDRRRRARAAARTAPSRRVAAAIADAEPWAEEVLPALGAPPRRDRRRRRDRPGPRRWSSR